MQERDREGGRGRDEQRDGRTMTEREAEVNSETRIDDNDNGYYDKRDCYILLHKIKYVSANRLIKQTNVLGENLCLPD